MAYKVFVQTTSLEYSICKRYSQFHTLNKAFQKIFYCWKFKFPHVKLFGALNEEQLRQRTNSLNKFLEYILQYYNIFQSYIVLQFLDLQSTPIRYL